LKAQHTYYQPRTMKFASIAPAFAVASALDVDTASPISKVLGILGGCEAKIIKEGEDAQKVYSEFAEWCEERNRNVGYEIKTGKSQVAELQATILKETSTQDALGTQIEELIASIATDEKDLAAATTIRGEENTDFKATEKELTEVIDSLNRAIGLIGREMAKGGASMMQLKSANSLKQAFTVMVQASVMSSADAATLTALVQSSNEDDDSEFGAPAAAAYESKSGGIVDTLQGLLDKAEEQLSTAQKKETTSKNNFDMLKQSLDDEVKFANKELDGAKKSLATSQETKATAEGDLGVTQKDLAEDIDTLSGTHHECLTTSQDFEAETNSRAEELKAIAAAKEALKNSGAASFFQISSSDEPSKLVVHFVRDLARKQNDQSLAQLASRMASAVRLSSSTGEDPFAKIKTLISDMLTKLEEDGAADASHKAYCDKEMAETKQKKIEKTAEVEHLSTKIDQKSSASVKLKEEVATLQQELAAMSKSQAEMDTLRSEQKSTYAVIKEETEQGLEGVKLALKVLRDYYSKAEKSSQGGASTGVIGMLEVVESDFSKSLAQNTAVEDAAAAEYYMQTKQNEVTKKMKDQDVKYKTKEFTGLDKSVNEHKTDREGSQEELDATLEALKRLEDMCIAKPESYADRASRRESEIGGLKEALSILESESAFVQRSVSHLRGVRAHIA